MPRTLQEVNQLLDQLRAARDKMDTDGKDLATLKETTATDSEAQAALLEAQIPPLRRHRDLVVDPKDEAGRQADNDQMRVLVNEAANHRQQAAKERVIAGRIRSLDHAIEAQNDKEICVYCIAHYDDNGDIIGATHLRHPIEDFEIKDRRGAVVRTAPGLKTLLSNGDADIDPADGRLWISGQRVGK